MKVMTILGTRPEIIRLSRIIPKLDKHCEHSLVHTGQNYDPNLNEIFFRELEIRQPDYYLGVEGKSFGEQIGQIMSRTEEVMVREKPERLLILGDTNSGLAAVTAKRMGIPVFHMEAGNRCYDDRVPEEVNRRIIDHSSDVLMPYTERSRANLIREGIPSHKIFVTGNPIYEVVDAYKSKIESSSILERLELEKGNYFLVTMHRAENVDDEFRLRTLIKTLSEIYHIYQEPIIFSLHPHTKDKMQKIGLLIEGEGIQFHVPFGFLDFIKLEQNAGCVLSDSGTVQEECCIFQVPNVTIRDVTERPETIECGSNILSGMKTEMIKRCINIVLNTVSKWDPPDGYIRINVSDTIKKILIGYHKDLY
ncbi:MAG TPA: UDP-N-acetylglucosamine 2-epimerase (non-hydrolyzing) [Atribacter sp.]|uniref:non-hydrolyzing UDP-N-acetylglucosamine 2-epimerase n=1 Tax=Atribacter sp. TaxID=2847780 RepID=UPI0002322790|nr:UDP-N-acetylglucosamine 2-epimerase (non-hydrolyzing) [Atribacter sp.]HQK83279.1 UDP-N-acetylglucosamine 2-epimerase (non-hydrolyzing) [Atribacter sp.]